MRGSRGRLRSGELLGVDDDPVADTRKPGIEHGFSDWKIVRLKKRWKVEDKPRTIPQLMAAADRGAEHLKLITPRTTR
jgi:hypothetical protein